LELKQIETAEIIFSIPWRVNSFIKSLADFEKIILTCLIKFSGNAISNASNKINILDLDKEKAIKKISTFISKYSNIHMENISRYNEYEQEKNKMIKATQKIIKEQNQADIGTNKMNSLDTCLDSFLINARK